MQQIIKFFIVTALVLLASPAFTLADEKPEPGKWVSLFNGKNLDGWTPKLRYEKLGEDKDNTFRVKDGVIQVGYEKYSEFGQRFGHLFYKDKFSHYRIRVEYRFTSDQVKGGPGWAFRNSGIMVHGQSAESMTKDQDFPASIEVQLLGGKGSGKRTTANLCTPGTHVVMNDKLFKPHCTSSKSETYHGDQWVVCEVEVRGSESIKHFINGKQVMEYQKPQLDGGDKELVKANGGELLLSEGTISLQSESHPVEFRKVEIMVLEK